MTFQMILKFFKKTRRDRYILPPYAVMNLEYDGIKFMIENTTSDTVYFSGSIKKKGEK